MTKQCASWHALDRATRLPGSPRSPRNARAQACEQHLIAPFTRWHCATKGRPSVGRRRHAAQHVAPQMSGSQVVHVIRAAPRPRHYVIDRGRARRTNRCENDQATAEVANPTVPGVDATSLCDVNPDPAARTRSSSTGLRTSLGPRVPGRERLAAYITANDARGRRRLYGRNGPTVAQDDAALTATRALTSLVLSVHALIADFAVPRPPFDHA